MTLRHLKIFVTVEETGSMSRAAKKLFLTQPTVSQAIKELEKHYGVLLFERLGKKLYITQAGEKLVSQARHLIYQFEELEENMASQQKNETLRIGSTITIGTCLLPGFIRQLQEKNPGLKTFGYVNNTEVIEEKILKAELDIGIVEGRIKSNDLVCIPIMQDELIIACGNKHPFANKKKLNLLDLQNQNYVMREKGSGTRELFENDMRNKSIELKISWEITSPDIIKEIIRMNQDLTAISVRLLEKELKSGEIIGFSHENRAWQREFSIVYHKHKKAGSGMKSLIELLKETEYDHQIMGLVLGKIGEEI